MNTFYKKLFVPVLVLGICFRILLPFVLGKNPRQGDGDEYFRYAYHLYHSGIYSDEIEQPVHSTAGKMPGTSLLIYAAALIFGVDSALLILPNIFFSCMILFLIFLFIRKIELDSFLTLVLFSAFSFIPVIDFYSGQFYPEIPATFFSLWGFYLVYEFSVNRNFSFWIFANFSFAIACFFRPELAFTGIVVSAVSLLENSSLREKIKTAIVFPVCLIVLLTPWTIRNIISTGNASPMGENFFIENLQGGTRPERCAQGLYSWLNTWHFKEKHVKMVAWDFPGADLDALPPYAFSLPGEKSRLKSLQEGEYNCEKDSLLKTISVEKMNADYLKHFLILPLKRSFFLLFRVERYDTFASTSIPTWALSFGWLILAIWSGLLCLGCLFAGLVLWKNNFWIKAVLATIITRLLFFAWFYHVESRYMLIFLPLYLMVVIVFILQQYDNHRSPEKSR